MTAWNEALKANCREFCACYGESACCDVDPPVAPCDDCIAGRGNPDWEAQQPKEGQADG